MYSFRGWYDGREDCEPPEPNKYWLSIDDEDSNEKCIIVYRTEEFHPNSEAVKDREAFAHHICDALNYFEQMEADIQLQLDG